MNAAKSPQPQTASSTASKTLRVHRRVDPDRRVVAITGSNAFLGKALLDRLESDPRYKQIISLDVAETLPRRAKTSFHRIDLTQPGSDADVAQLLERYRVDTLVHLALLTRPTPNIGWAHELEVIGTLNVLNACAACSLHKVVTWSLTTLYGPHKDNPALIAEDSQLRGLPGSRFFTDKLEAERLAQRFAGENPATTVTLLRTAPILGKHCKNFLSKYLSHPVVPTLLGYDPLLQLLGEKDAVDAFKLCVDADFSGAFNIAGPGVLPLSTVIALAGRLSLPVPGVVARLVTRGLWASQLTEIPPRFIEFLRHSCVVETSRSERELSFHPKRNIHEVVLDFAEGEVSP